MRKIDPGQLLTGHNSKRVFTFLLRSLVGISLLLYLCCATVPITERKVLRLIPEGQLLSMSLDQYGEILRKSKLSEDRKKVERVKKPGSELPGLLRNF